MSNTDYLVKRVERKGVLFISDTILEVLPIHQ